MKKTLFLVVLFLCIILSGCKTNNKYEAKFNQMMDICGKDGITIIEEHQITKDKVVYKYDSLIRAELKKNQKRINDHIDTWSVQLLGDYVYVSADYSNKTKNDKIVCRINVDTLKVEILLFSSEKSTLVKLNDYLLLNNNDKWTFFDIHGNIMDVEVDGTNYKLCNNCYASKDFNEKCTIYDYNFNKYEVVLNSCWRVDKLYHNYLFYIDTNSEMKCVDVETNLLCDEQQTKELSEQSYNDNRIKYYISSDKVILSKNDEEITSLVALRELNDYINITEEIFDTSCSIIKAIELDDVLYIAVGNNDSFFGLATTKMTYSLIYKLCEDGTIKYVGCSGSAYAYLLGVIDTE